MSRDVSVVDLPVTRAIYFGLLLIQVVGYWVLINRLKFPISKSDGRWKAKSSKLGNWLKIFHYSFGIFMLVFLATYLILTISPWNYGEIRYGAQLSMAVLVHIIGYYTIKNSSTLAYLNNTSDNPTLDENLKVSIRRPWKR